MKRATKCFIEQCKLNGIPLLTYSMEQSPSWESNRFCS